MSEPVELVRLNRARQEIAKAKGVDQVKRIRDKAEAARVYARKIGMSREAQNDLGEIIVEAEVRAGELLRAAAETGQRDSGHGDQKSGCPKGTPKLADLGVTKKQSHAWQRIAQIPTVQREEYVAQTRAAGGEVTTGGLLKVARETARAERVEAIRRTPPEEAPGKLKSLEEGQGLFRCLYIDPPWDYDDDSGRGAAAGHYPTMDLKKLQKIQVGDLAHVDGCHLWLWTTWPKIRDQVPHQLLAAWGFRWVGEVVWNKQAIGTGRWLRSQTEVLILAVKGNPLLLERDQGGFLEAPRGRHSEKPIEARAIVERLSPGPRLELFARVVVEGWSRWGLEA